jgi:hypothetical protein
VATTALDIPARYDQPRRIGRGGMGEIWLVHDTELARDVVLKLLRADCDTNVIGRFRREALAAARLSGHPHVVTIYDVGEHDGCPYIVMEYLPGGTVAHRLHEGVVPLDTCVRWIREAAEALDAAHAAGIVHRDVKPGNLLLDERDRVRVGDFGIARAAHAAAVTQTAPGTVLGTAGYLSPEQAAGEQVTSASDRYSLGVVAFELLAGRRPFERESFAAEAAAHVHEPVPSIRAAAADRDLPPAVDSVIDRALAKDPAQRFATAAAFADALAAALADAPDTRAIAPTIVEPRPAAIATGPSWYDASGRRTRLIVAAVLALLVLGLLLAALTGGSPSKQRAAPDTKRPAATAPEVELSREEAIALHEQAFALIQAGRYAEALPIERRALAALRGVAPYEAYANYDIGLALLRLGSCAQAIPFLDRSEELQGERTEIDSARREAEACVAEQSGAHAKPAKDGGKGKPHGKHK